MNTDIPPIGSKLQFKSGPVNTVVSYKEDDGVVTEMMIESPTGPVGTMSVGTWQNWPGWHYADTSAERQVAELQAVIAHARLRHHAKRIQVGSSTHGGPPQYGEVCSCGAFSCSLYLKLAAPHDVLDAVLADARREERALIVTNIRRHCTPSSEAYKAGGDELIRAVADWVENPPEWVTELRKGGE